MNTIVQVAETGLYCRCGTCAAVSPSEAVKMKVSETVSKLEIRALYNKESKFLSLG